MKLSYYICKFGQVHLKGINCLCHKPAYISERKCHG